MQVLDNGAVPTVPQWSSRFIQELVLTCVSRDAAHRPSFTDIILYLQEFLHLDESDYFVQFDFFRMMDLITSDRHYFNALGASEIAIWAFNETFRLDQGTPEWAKLQTVMLITTSL